MSRRDKQADFLLLRGRDALIEACRPLLVFSRVSTMMMQLYLLLSLSALAAKMGAGGKKQPATTPADALAATHGGEGHFGNQRVPPPPPRLQHLCQQSCA